MTYVNPHKEDALTMETVEAGQRIIVWAVRTPDSSRRYKVLNHPYVDDDGDMVVELMNEEGQERVLLTSEAGLTGGRYDGAWTHIAIIDDEYDN